MKKKPQIPKPPRTIKAQAKAAADLRREPSTPILWSAAIAEAPVPAGSSEASAVAFRKHYAQELVKLGHAKAAGKPGNPTKLPRRLLTAPQSEFDEHEVRRAAAGLSWNEWARRRLLQ